LADAVWVETGTYRGDTAYFLSKIGQRVISIEPHFGLFAAVIQRFEGNPRISVKNDTSESSFEATITELSGPTCFWLDGHFSGEGTFKADNESQIRTELDALGKHLLSIQPLVVFVDDFRCFTYSNAYEPSEYPSANTLVS
jgi:hypothetical protein